MSKILVTGGHGLVGMAIKNIISHDDNNIYHFTNSTEADLTNYESCFNLFKMVKPDKVVHLAANVGGLYKNINQKVDMLEKNLLINLNVIRCCHYFGVSRFIGCLSTCIFPDDTQYPINENMLHNGPPHNSNDSYAYAKRMLEIHCKSYQEQYSKNYMCIIPTNIYGPYDNFNLENSHVIPGLIHKCYLAKKFNKDFIIYGSGKPLRQFIYSEDLAKFIIWILNNDNLNETIIISPDITNEISIKEIAEIIAKEFDYGHRIKYDESKSDGQYKKTADNTKLKNLYGNLNLIPIKEGIRKSILWFKSNYENCRK